MGDCWVKMMRVDSEGIVFLISEVNFEDENRRLVFLGGIVSEI